MNFKEWILINEIQHFSLPTMNVNGITTDGIDFRFEDWSKGYNEKKQTILKAPPPNGKAYFDGPFSAPLKNGSFLNVCFEKEEYVLRHRGGGVATRYNTKISLDHLPLERMLPKQWFDFAVLYLRGHVVKPPEWPRNPAEQGRIAEIE